MSILIVTPVALKVPPRGGPSMKRVSFFALGLMEATSNSFLGCADTHGIATAKRMAGRSSISIRDAAATITVQADLR